VALQQDLLHIPDAGKRSLIHFLQEHLQSDGNSTREADNVKESKAPNAPSTVRTKSKAIFGVQV
jgi:hypothetical protein